MTIGGRADDDTGTFWGYMDELMMFNYALSANEIATLAGGYNGFNVTILDSTTKQIVDENITVQIVSDSFQDEKTTINGRLVFQIPYNVTQEQFSIRAFETSGNDYTIVTREYAFASNINYSTIIYMANTSDTEEFGYVTLRTLNEDGEELRGAIIHILKQDPSTGEFINAADLTTNPNGEATTLLQYNNAFYKFLVDYNGQQVYQSPAPFPISINDDVIVIICLLGDPYSDYYDRGNSITIDVDYENTTNVSGRFSLTYTSKYQASVCLNVSEIINMTQFFNQTVCQNGTSGTFYSSVLAPPNRTLYLAQSYYDLLEGYGYRPGDAELQYIGVTVGEREVQKVEKSVIFIVAILLSAFGFMVSPVAGLIVLLVSLVIIYSTGITLLSSSPITLMTLISLIIMSIVTVVKKRASFS